MNLRQTKAGRYLTVATSCGVLAVAASACGVKSNTGAGTGTTGVPSAQQATQQLDSHLTPDQIAIQKSLQQAIRQDLPAPTTGLLAEYHWAKNMYNVLQTQSGRQALSHKTAQDFVKDYAATPEGKKNHIDPNDQNAVAAAQAAIDNYFHTISFTKLKGWYSAYKTAGGGQKGMDAIGKLIGQDLTVTVNGALATHGTSQPPKGKARAGASVQ